MDTEKRFFVPCDCYCNIIAIDFIDEKDGCLYVSNYVSSFYEKQGILSNLANRIKLLWFILRGKEFSLYDVVIDKEMLQDFKEWVAEL